MSECFFICFMMSMHRQHMRTVCRITLDQKLKKTALLTYDRNFTDE